MSYTNLKNTLNTQLPSLILKENPALSSYTTFKIGGICPLMASPSTKEELVTCILAAKKENIPCFPLGNGSNLLVADEGIHGFLLHTKGLNTINQVDSLMLEVESGALLGKLSNFAAKNQLSGLEFAQGIPGSVGGAVVMNAGAYGGEMSQIIHSVTSYSPEKEIFITRTVEELDFSYRHSIFSYEKEIILSALFKLTHGDTVEIQEKMKEFSKQRQEKQPLNFPSCGSTFKRPPNHFAAALIEQCGLKGLTIGGAQVSSKHAGFVINIGDATCKDVITLTYKIIETVFKETGITLELEVQLLQ